LDISNACNWSHISNVVTKSGNKDLLTSRSVTRCVAGHVRQTQRTCFTDWCSQLDRVRMLVKGMGWWVDDSEWYLSSASGKGNKE
jgi:hypothetical protein